MSKPPTLSRRLALLGFAAPVIGATLGARRPSASTPTSDILVAYLTRSGNTRVVARTLARRFDADLFRIRTAEPYPDDYDAHVELASQQRETGTPPRLAETVQGFDAYRTLYLCFPIWGGAIPPPVRSFLTAHDPGSRRLLPCITHGGYGIGSALDTLTELAPDADIQPAFEQVCDAERDTIDMVSDWHRGLPG